MIRFRGLGVALVLDVSHVAVVSVHSVGHNLEPHQGEVAVVPSLVSSLPVCVRRGGGRCTRHWSRSRSSPRWRRSSRRRSRPARRRRSCRRPVLPCTRGQDDMGQGGTGRDGTGWRGRRRPRTGRTGRGGRSGEVRIGKVHRVCRHVRTRGLLNKGKEANEMLRIGELSLLSVPFSTFSDGLYCSRKAFQGVDSSRLTCMVKAVNK